MKVLHIILAGAAALSAAACNGEQGAAGNSAAESDTGPVEAVQRPASGDWSEAVTATHEGGFVMGNPAAEVKVVEFGSMTCPACAAFDETGMPALIDNYVKDGRVSFEFRNFVRDPYDITASLIARCNGASTFFPLTRAMYSGQRDWMGKLQGVPPEQAQAIQTMAPAQQFATIAGWAGLQQFAAMRGVPTAKSSQCLANQSEIDRLVQMNSDASTQYQIQGTPSFLINGKVVPDAHGWPLLEPAIKQALGG